ncbi:PP2C family protein-serine/threonine phosphatase, partial [Planctomycetota bacterium]
INRRLILEKLQRKLSTHSIWQVTDGDDVWVCPYCASSTGVKLPEPRRYGVSEHTLNEVWSHLSSCSTYRGKRPQLKSKSVILQTVAQSDHQNRLRREVRHALLQDKRFSVHDAFGSWLCPYCRKVQKRISVSTERSLVDKTTEQVVTHLSEQCSHYIEGQEPSALFDELRNQVQQEPAGLKASRGSEGDDSAWVRRIDQEVALKSQVEISKDLARSLEDARSRQLRLLPELPLIDGFEFGVVYQPHGRVGGDFYDFYRVSETEFGIAVGDVAGHGIEAALLVGLAKKLIEIHGRGRSSPGQTLLLANADIFPDLDARTFVTVFLGILNPAKRTLRFARAGHNPLLLFNPNRTPRLRVLDSKGMALGMDAGPIFYTSIEDVEVPLQAGDLLIQYTDGVTESTNHENEEFGLERLYAVIKRYGSEEAEYVLYKIERAVSDFREGARQKDDITLVAIKVLQ